MELIIKYIQEKDHVHIRLTQYECICKHTEMIPAKPEDGNEN